MNGQGQLDIGMILGCFSCFKYNTKGNIKQIREPIDSLICFIMLLLRIKEINVIFNRTHHLAISNYLNHHISILRIVSESHRRIKYIDITLTSNSYEWLVVSISNIDPSWDRLILQSGTHHLGLPSYRVNDNTSLRLSSLGSIEK